MGDFVLVELQLEEGRNAGTLVCYVGQVLELQEDGMLNISFLRMRSVFVKNTFCFPTIEDEEPVTRDKVKGVLTTTRSGTKRQASLIQVTPPLNAFNMQR